jgi:hypothetical protein
VGCDCGSLDERIFTLQLLCLAFAVAR